MARLMAGRRYEQDAELQIDVNEPYHAVIMCMPANKLDNQAALNSAHTTAPLCPARVRRQAPVTTLQIRAELSWEVVTMNMPQGEKAAPTTQSSCPISDVT